MDRVLVPPLLIPLHASADARRGNENVQVETETSRFRHSAIRLPTAPLYHDFRIPLSHSAPFHIAGVVRYGSRSIQPLGRSIRNTSVSPVEVRSQLVVKTTRSKPRLTVAWGSAQ